jgi:1-acyl-sn-glycerol-3-phosphate acyltransferase
MRGVLFVLTVIGQLLAWDLAMKLILLFSYQSALGYVDRRVSRWAQRLFGFAHAYVGFRIRYIDSQVEIPDRFILVSNHQSLADIVALMASFSDRQVRFVAKRELRHGFPAVSQVLRLQRHALIDRRGNFTETMREIELLGKRSRRRGWCPVIFPEGTRSRDGIVKTFHAGAVRRLAESTGFPILAVAVDGGHKVSRLSDFVGNEALGLYRVRPVAAYPPSASKHELRDRLADAEARIARQVAVWQGR